MQQHNKGWLVSATFIRQIPSQATGFYGLFSGEIITAGSFIGEYCGEVMTLQEYAMVCQQNPYFNTSYTTKTKLGQPCFINAYHKGSKTCYANHSHDPNAELVTTIHEGQYKQYIRALRRIGYGEEITIDYGWVWEDTPNRAPTKCFCGARSCTGYLEKGYNAKRTLEHYWGKPTQPLAPRVIPGQHQAGRQEEGNTRHTKRKEPPPQAKRPPSKRTKPPDEASTRTSPEEPTPLTHDRPP